MKKVFQHTKANGGFTVIEVLVAIFIITVGMGGLISVIQFGESTTLDADTRLTAAYLAQEGLEATRQIRDSNFLEVHRGGVGTWQNNGLSEVDCGPPTGCQLVCREDDSYYPSCDPPGGDSDFIDIELVAFTDEFLTFEDGYYAQSSPTGQQTPFKRRITVTESGDLLDVSVEVTWTLPQSSGSLTTATQFYNWLPTSP